MDIFKKKMDQLIHQLEHEMTDEKIVIHTHVIIEQLNNNKFKYNRIIPLDSIINGDGFHVHIEWKNENIVCTIKADSITFRKSYMKNYRILTTESVISCTDINTLFIFELNKLIQHR